MNERQVRDDYYRICRRAFAQGGIEHPTPHDNGRRFARILRGLLIAVAVIVGCGLLIAGIAALGLGVQQ